MKGDQLVHGEMYYVRGKHNRTNMILECLVGPGDALMYSEYETIDVQTGERTKRKRYKNVRLSLIQLPRTDEELERDSRSARRRLAGTTGRSLQEAGDQQSEGD